VERIAELMSDKKLPLLGDVRDESAEEIRLVLEPKSRTVDAVLLMESLFRLTELEVRFGLNMNVLSAGQIPNVLGLKDVLKQWLEHRVEVLIRRTEYRLRKIAHRLEVLDGYLVAYLNIEEVIRIVRFEDDPKASLIRTFSLTEVQAEAILNLRLKSLSKLEEVEIRAEHDALSKEQRQLQTLLKSEELQWDKISDEIKATRERYSKKTPLGRRRSAFADAPEIDVDLEAAMIEKEPITVICSAKGWIRAMKGHSDLSSAEALKFKEGDGPAWAFHAQTTDRLVLAASDGRFYTLMPDRLPGGRGLGEPVRLMIDLAEGTDIVALFAHRPDGRLLLAASDGRGFQVDAGELLAETRKGRQVMSPRTGATLKVVRWIDAADDMVAVIGENRKLLVFPITELPQLQKGQGVALQKYKDGGMADARTFVMADGLTWPMGGGSGRMRTESDLTFWKGARASAGRMPPTGFPRDNRFTP
jgi:topoisomerase-4 subunit A